MPKPQQAGFSVLKSSALNLEPFSSISNALPRDVSDPCLFSLFRYSGWEGRSILSIPLHVSEHKSRRHLSDPTLAGDNQACIRLKPFRRRCPDMFSVTWELSTTENIFWSQTKFGAAGKWGFRIGDNLISTCLQLGKHLGAWKRFLHRLMKEGGSCSLFA